MGLSVTMYRDFALVIEVNMVTHTDRTVIARPHMTPEGLFLATIVEVENFSEAVRIIDETLDEDGPDNGGMAAIEGTTRNEDTA